MIVSTLIAASIASAEPPAPAQPATAPAPAAEKTMACCAKMKSGEGCDCCKPMDAKGEDAAPADGGHGHDH